nr:transposase [Candidatus Sigynarchaeota archaeon]
MSTHLIKTNQLLKHFVSNSRPERRLTIKWPSDALATCPLCDSPIRFKHISGKRWVKMLQWILVVRHAYYACTNKKCALHHPFTVPNDIVLPFKHHGRDVWERVVMLHVSESLPPDKISDNIWINFHFKVSASTVARIIDAYEILKSSSLDEKALAKVKKAGFMVIALDGQRPENGKSGLWYITDVISNVVLHVEYLTCADTAEIGRMLKTIEQKYGVPIKAVLSDHQSSIVNAVAEYLPEAKHQYCHFHFLKNIATPLAAIDTHLQKTMESGIRNLYINRADRSKPVALLDGVKEPVRDFFKPVMDDLLQLVNNDRKLFDTWAGLASFNNVKEHVLRLEETRDSIPDGSRARKIMSKTVDVVKKLLEDASVHAEKLEALVPRLNEIRLILSNENDKPWKMHAKAREWVQTQEWSLHEAGIDVPDENRRIEQLNYDASVTDVQGQWVHLYNSHDAGLYHFLSVPGLPRANSAMEREFSVENRFFRSNCGTSMVGHSVRVKGDVVLKILKDKEENGPSSGDSIQAVLDTHDPETLAHGNALFKERRDAERRTWKKVKKSVQGFAQVIKRVITLKQGKKA